MKPLGRSNEIAIGVVVVLCLSAGLVYGVYAHDGPATSAGGATTTFTTMSTPGDPCNGTLTSQVQEIENSAKFSQESQGECYSYIGSSTVTQENQTSTVYGFDYFNGTVGYPCGTFPVETVISQIDVTVPPNGSVTSASYQLDNDTTGLNIYEGCGPHLPSVGIVSAQTLAALVPVVPEVNLTLSAANSGQPITRLSAVIEAQGGNLTLVFSQVSTSSPLEPGNTTWELGLLNAQVSLTPGLVYPMTISGTFSDGTTFSYAAQIVPVSSQ